MYNYEVALLIGNELKKFTVKADNDYSVTIERDPMTQTNWQVIGKHRFPLERVVAIIRVD